MLEHALNRIPPRNAAKDRLLDFSQIERLSRRDIPFYLWLVNSLGSGTPSSSIVWNVQPTGRCDHLRNSATKPPPTEVARLIAQSEDGGKVEGGAAETRFVMLSSCSCCWHCSRDQKIQRRSRWRTHSRVLPSIVSTAVAAGFRHGYPSTYLVALAKEGYFEPRGHRFRTFVLVMGLRRGAQVKEQCRIEGGSAAIEE